MNRSKTVIYLVIPVVLSLLLLGMYFSRNLVLQRIVSPKLPPLSPDSWREFGLLENLQNLLLLLMLGAACAGIYRKKWVLEKVFWAVALLGILFVFLEEIDYGRHIWVYLNSTDDYQWFLPMKDWPPALIAAIDLDQAPLNIHNYPGLDKVLKKTGDLFIVVLFVVLPLVALRVRKPWLRYIAPDKYAILTVAAMVILRFITHALGDLEEAAVEAARAAGNLTLEPGSISKNLSEFRETNFYYLLLVYFMDIAVFRPSPFNRDAEPLENETATTP